MTIEVPVLIGMPFLLQSLRDKMNDGGKPSITVKRTGTRKVRAKAVVEAAKKRTRKAKAEAPVAVKTRGRPRKAAAV
ncbi:MAG: hypothetical protein EBT06_12125 [Gammaproteobacteria bacterium]|nr:hypothetical protein [Gammaproteobacteria bacterium]